MNYRMNKCNVLEKYLLRESVVRTFPGFRNRLDEAVLERNFYGSRDGKHRAAYMKDRSEKLTQRFLS